MLAFSRKCILGLFFLFLTSGFVGVIIGIEPVIFSIAESRSPHEFPRIFPLKEMKRRIKRFENWWGDRVYGRPTYMSLYQTLGLSVLTPYKETSVIQGSNDWLFLGNRYENVLFYTKNAKPATPEAVAEKLAWIAEMADECKKRGIVFVLFIAPNKHTIYQEFLPSYFHAKDSVRLADATLLEAKKQGIPFIFPRKEIEAAKSGHPLYFKSDTHWNGAGAYLGLKAAWQELVRQDPSLMWPEYAPVTIVESGETHFGDLLTIGKLSKRLQDKTYWYCSFPQRPDITKIINPNPNSFTDKRLLFIADSFGAEWRPFLSAFFRDVKEVHHLKLEDKFIEYLDDYKPNVVIFEQVERYFQ